MTHPHASLALPPQHASSSDHSGPIRHGLVRPTRRSSWLPGGGWPQAALSEVLHAEPGTGELALALPLVAQLTQRQLTVAFVNAPRLPSAAGLLQRGVTLEQLRVVQPQATAANDQARESLWAAEQLLRSGHAAVLVWADAAPAASLRRLQQAAEHTGGQVLLFRSLKRASEASPAVLRLAVRREGFGVGGGERAQVQVLKGRGV